jgi:hypothetical protein
MPYANSFHRFVILDGISHYSITETMAQVRNVPSHPIPTIWVLITVNEADIGKVLAGIQAPEEDSTRFSEFLRELGYSYVEETQNVIYRRYLRK